MIVNSPYSGRELRLGETMDQLLHPEPVRHQLGDRDEGETVLRRESLELRTPRARAHPD